MNVGDARTEILEILNAARGAYFKDDVILRALNRINRLVYRAVSQLDPSHHTRWDNVTFTAGALSVDLATALGASIGKLLAVGVAPNPGNPSGTNIPVPVALVTPRDFEARAADAWPTTLPSRSFGDAHFASLAGATLYLAPVPQSVTYLRVRWIPEPRTLTGDTDGLLTTAKDTATASIALPFHDLVVTLSAKMLAVKEKRSAPELTEIVALVRGMLEESEGDRSGADAMVYEDPY